MIFDNKQCKVLVLRDVTPIRQNVKLQSGYKMLSMVQSSISHEMLTPIKCIMFMTEQLKNKFKDNHYNHTAQLVINTALLLKN